MQIALLAAFLAVFTSLAAQTPRKAPLTRPLGDAVSRLRLGMSQQQVLSMLGAPDGIAGPLGRSEASPLAYRVALSVHGREHVGDFYLRSTAANKYEVILFYLFDASKSRLNPTPRLNQINFTLDRDMPLSKLLAENPIFADNCRNGCCIDEPMLEPTSLPESVKNAFSRPPFVKPGELLSIETRFILPVGTTLLDGEDWRKSIISGSRMSFSGVAAEGCGGERVWKPF